jgi:hypothetical protein
VPDRALIGLAVALTALGAGACTTTPPAPAPTSVRSTAGSTTSTGPVDPAVLGGRIHAAMVKAGSGTGTVTLTGTQPVTASLKFAYPNGQSQVSQATFAVIGTQLDAVYSDSGTFVRGLPPALASGKTWARIEPNETDVVSTAVREIGGAATDPRAALTAFPGGQATVVDRQGGTTRYAVTASSAQAAGPAPLDLSVDADDLPTRMTVTVAGQTVTVVYRDWGAPVAVTVPSSDEVGALSLPSG